MMCFEVTKSRLSSAVVFVISFFVSACTPALEAKETPELSIICRFDAITLSIAGSAEFLELDIKESLRIDIKSCDQLAEDSNFCGNYLRDEKPQKKYIGLVEVTNESVFPSYSAEVWFGMNRIEINNKDLILTVHDDNESITYLGMREGLNVDLRHNYPEYTNFFGKGSCSQAEKVR